MKVVNFLMALVFFGTVLPLCAGESSVTVTNVEAHQRYPWNGLVDIVVTLQGDAKYINDYVCVFAATNNETQMMIPVKHIVQNGSDTGLGINCTRKYIWDLKSDVGSVKIDDVVLTVEAQEAGVQLWRDGPYWATCNVGATKPEEYGYYFWWGDTEGWKYDGKDLISIETGALFPLGRDCPTMGKIASELRSAGFIDSTGNLTLACDAARVHLGVPWRMPTAEELEDLMTKCDSAWTSRNGVWGRLIKGRDTYVTKSIFLPAAGFGDSFGLYLVGTYGGYLSSTSTPSSDSYSWILYFNSSLFDRDGYYRTVGQSLRPVRKLVQ